MKTRALSAIAAVLLLVGIAVMWRTQGLYVISSIMALGAIREYSRLIFGFRFISQASEHFGEQSHLRWAFAIFSFAIFLSTALGESIHSLVALSLSGAFFLAMALMSVRTNDDLPSAIHVQGLGLMGFFYCGLFPGLATRLLQLNETGLWLFALLAIVFSGDTMAYLVGRAFGKHKLLEAVSPKKTIEGSLGGLLGSGIAGAILAWIFVQDASLPDMVFMALVTGAFAQLGDLFESLLKRVAEVKDSGAIMPGHGGVLDRLDGVIFAAPIFYILVRFLLS